jgi:hypothetical protein
MNALNFSGFSCLTIRLLYDLTVVAGCLMWGQLKIPKVPERELLTTRALFFLAAAAFTNALNLSRF